MPLNPYTAQLLKRVRDLPLAEVKDLMGHLKYVDRWVYTNEANQRVEADASTRGEARCIGRESSCVAHVRQLVDVWGVTCEGESVGTAPNLATALDMADTELELRGYILPWRREA